MLVKKFYIRFVLKISLSYYIIYLLTRKIHLNIWDNYIQAILKGIKQLVAKADYLEFENKELIKALKAKKRKKNRDKKLNSFYKINNGPKFFFSRVYTAYNFKYDKKVEKQ